MQTYSIHIKNLNCPHCTAMIKERLERMNFQIERLEPGEMIINGTPNLVYLRYFSMLLNQYGVKLIADRDTMIVEKIKSLIVDLIYNQDKKLKNIKFSEYLSENIELNYCYLSNLFSKINNTTIEKFIINTKIERVKEWLRTNEFNLKHIAGKLGYRSVHHLSHQFRKVTHITIRDFMKSQKSPGPPIIPDDLKIM